MLLFPGANEPLYNEDEWTYDYEEDEEEAFYEELNTNSSFADTNGNSKPRVHLPQPNENTCKPLSVDITTVSTLYIIFIIIIFLYVISEWMGHNR